MVSLSVKLRHGIVRRIAPKLYIDYLDKYKLPEGFFVHVPDLPRQGIVFIKPRVFKPSILEIGTQKGLNAVSMIKELEPREITLVDPFISYKQNLRDFDFSNDKCDILYNTRFFNNVRYYELTSDQFFEKYNFFLM